MSYNNEIKKSSLEDISLETFKEAIYLSYKDGITSIAPLGFSGDTVIIHGVESGGRCSLVSIRNYSGDAELLITDKKGNFLFYGRFDINLGVEFVADEYYRIFNLLKDKILIELPNVSAFRDMQFAEHCTKTTGFDMLAAYQNSMR